MGLKPSRQLARTLRATLDQVPVVVVDSALDDCLERCWLGQHTSLSEFLMDFEHTVQIHNHQLEQEITE